MSTLSQNLRKARALISEPGTNIKNVGHMMLSDRRKAYCAHAAIIYSLGIFEADRAAAAISTVLKRRHAKGLLPPPTHSGGVDPPYNGICYFAVMNTYRA